MSAEELAQQIDAAGEGNALIRTQLEVRLTEGARHVMQLQIKSAPDEGGDRSRLPDSLA